MKKIEPIRIAVIGGSGIYNIEALTDVTEIKVKTPFGRPIRRGYRGDAGGQPRGIPPAPRTRPPHPATEVNSRPTLRAQTLGVERVLSISACGSLREDFKPRDIVIPDQLYDHTKLRSGHTFFGRGLVAHISFAHPFCADFSRQ